MTRRRVVSRVAIAAVTIIFGVAGCFAIAEVARVLGAMADGIGEAKRQMTTTPEENHELQKATAQNFREQFPATETITFTNEGSVAGSGNWAANAVVTIAGKEYQEILGTMMLGGDDLPAPDSIPPAESTTIRYSDGSSETLR